MLIELPLRLVQLVALTTACLICFNAKVVVYSDLRGVYVILNLFFCVLGNKCVYLMCDSSGNAAYT